MELDKDLQARQEARQLLRQAKQAQAQLATFPQEKLDAALARCAQLEEQLANVPAPVEAPAAPAAPTEQELEAYRRAEQAERLAMERAQQIYTQANAILADTTAKAEAAAARIAELAKQANAQLQAYQDAVSCTQSVFQEAVDALGAIKAE